MAEKRPSLKTAMSGIVEAQQSLAFHPTDDQMKLKAKFWTLQRENPSADPELITASLVAEVTNSPKVQEWWKISGFKEWFTNANEAREKAEYVFGLLLDAVEEIAKSRDPKAFTAQLRAFETLGSYLGHIGKDKKTEIPGLPSDPSELRALVQSLSKKLGLVPAGGQ